MKRIVQPELLDELPPADPRAARSRRDLRRVNAWMQNQTLMADALRTAVNGTVPRQITELGAGDGNFLLRVAQRLASFGVPPSGGLGGNQSPDRVNAELRTQDAWNAMGVTLLDRQRLVTAQTQAAFAALGWRAETVVADVFNWPPAPSDIVVANLFLHHFDDVRLAELFRDVAGRARLFVAIEPRRGGWPLFCSRLLWAIGCNSVTRHDATVSVRAGFSGNELSALWPAAGDWQLTECAAGLFSHLFVARRKY